MFLRTNAKNHSFTGTASAVKILDSDPNRSYLCLFAVSGDCQVVFGSNDFDNNAVTMPEHFMWEPRITPTEEVWFKGNGSKLTVIY